jgi:type I restriction enzyme M protein
MRKDRALNGDIDRMPMLTWTKFLKFLDDLERGREEEAEMAGFAFVPALVAPIAGATGPPSPMASPATS